MNASRVSASVIRRVKQANVRLRPGHLYYSPEWIVLGVNNTCNLHCTMCDVGTGFEKSNFYHHLMGADPLNMPLDLLREILRQTAEFFPRAKVGYAFTEPIIYPHLIESLEYADSLGLFTSVTTNGSKLPALASDLAAAGLDQLCVSLDGPPAVHNRIRRHPRSFEFALDGISKLLEIPSRPKISIFCTVSEHNVGYLREFLSLFQDMPLQQIGFLHTNFTTAEMAADHNHQFAESYPATPSNVQLFSERDVNLEELWREITLVQKATHRFPVTFSPEIHSFEELERFYRKPKELIGRICNDAFRTLMLKSDGTAIPAHGRCYRVTGGSLYESNLKELWNATAIAAFRKTLLEAGGLLPACARCCSAF